MQQFMDAVKETLTQNYSNFSGRTRRSTYWYYALFAFIVGLIAQGLDAVLGLKIGEGNSSVGVLNLLVSLALFMPSLSAVVRRLHDTGKSGWTYLIILVPIIGAFYILYLLVQDSQPGSNKWGSSPKEEVQARAPANNW